VTVVLGGGQRLGVKTRLAFAATRAAGVLYAVVRRWAHGTARGEIRSILVSRRGRVGDFVVVLPMLGALRARYPRARIVLGVDAEMPARALLGESGLVDEIRRLDHLSEPSFLARLRGLIRLFLEGFDVVISGEDFSLIQEAFYSGAPLLVGMDDGHPLQRWNAPRLPCDPARTAAENHLALAELLDARPRRDERAPRIPRSPSTSNVKWMPPGLAPGSPFVVLHPGAQKPSRRWPSENFAQLARHILEARPDLRVVLSGTSEETPLVSAILESLPAGIRGRCLSSAGRTDLAGLVSLLDRARLLVCNDTGVMHLARARGTPLVALLGPENDRYWGPHPEGWGAAVAIRHVVPCAPCRRWDCEALHCLRSLTPGEAFAAVSLLLDHAAPTSGIAEGAPPRDRSADLPLVRMVRRHDWRDLCAAGFAIPKVSLVRLDDPVARRLLGWRVLARRLVVTKAPEASASGFERAYPSVESLDVRHSSHGALALAAAPGPERSLSIRPDDPRAAWAAIVHAARGEFLALLRPGESGSDLGAAVAVLMRTPVLDAVARRDGLRLVRRSALATIVSQAGRASGRSARWSALRMAVRHGS
jgi:ADP-heptose:LPS heptosyltransferase